MSASICHRTLRALGPNDTAGSPCIGSRCALWAPEIRNPRAGSVHPMFIYMEGPEESADQATRGTYADGHVELTGRGWCADNLRAHPFADPAVPK